MSSEEHPPTAQELAWALGIDNPSQLSEQITSLLERGFCCEHGCADDRRHSHYGLTEAGEKHLNLWLEHHEVVLDKKHYREARLDAVTRVLQNLVSEIKDQLETLNII